MKFKADELKKRVDTLIDAGVEVIVFDEGFGRRCFISGYSPHIPEHDIYEGLKIIIEED